MSSKAERIILLADMDCFFVEVERLHRPELRGQAVIIGGQPDKRGVVSACSYEARRFGVHSAMPMGEAYRRLGLDPSHGALPEGRTIERKGVIVNFLHSGLHGNYGLYSRRVQDIAQAMVPVFKPKSVDEFEMDITGCETIFTRDYGGIIEFAQEMRRRVRSEVGLPMSIGIGPGRLIAKMASRHAKPDGVFRVSPSQVESFLAPHDVQDVPGIGPVTAGTLRDMGIKRVGQLLDHSPALLRQTFGIGMWSLVNTLKHGEDRAVPPPDTGGGHEHGSMGKLMREDGHESPAIGFGPGRSKPKSIGHSVTLERDTLDEALLRRTLWRLTEDACRRLREKDLAAGHVTVTIRYSDFQTVTHGTMLSEPTDLDRVIYETALRLLDEGRTRRLRIRLVGVRLEKLRAGLSQLSLFEPVAVTKERTLTKTLDIIREKHGRDMVLSGPGVRQIGSVRISTDSQAGVSLSISPQRSAV